MGELYVQFLDAGILTCCALSLFFRIVSYTVWHRRVRRLFQVLLSDARGTAALLHDEPASAAAAAAWLQLRAVLVDVGLLREAELGTECSVASRLVSQGGRADPLIALLTLPLELRLSALGNWLSVVSNCLTYYLRPSQVLYTFLFCNADFFLFLGSMAACEKGLCALSGQQRPQQLGLAAWGSAWQLIVLNLLLTVTLVLLHVHELFFSVGLASGYVACCLTLFLLGGEMAKWWGARRGGAAAKASTTLLRRLPDVLDSFFACLCCVCYFLMLLEESEELYSTHGEFMRWYVNTAALGLCNGLTAVRLLFMGA